jgi:hypothetical protein
MRVACLNFQFWCTHKCLRVHQKCEETSSAASSSQSCVHGAPQHVLVTASPNWTNAHACPSLFSHARGHGELNITSLASGQCRLSSSMSSGDFAGKLSISGSCLAYSTTYHPHMFSRCLESKGDAEQLSSLPSQHTNHPMSQVHTTCYAIHTPHKSVHTTIAIFHTHYTCFKRTRHRFTPHAMSFTPDKHPFTPQF